MSTPAKQWGVYETELMPVRHVMPEADTKPHRLSTLCECQPLIDADELICVVIHHAYDGREKYER